MKREKIIRKIGDSVGIIFNREEQQLFNLKVNNKVKISIEKLNDIVVEESK